MPSKVTHNWLGLEVFSPAGFFFVQLRQFCYRNFFFILEFVKLCRMKKYYISANSFRTSMYCDQYVRLDSKKNSIRQLRKSIMHVKLKLHSTIQYSITYTQVGGLSEPSHLKSYFVTIQFYKNIFITFMVAQKHSQGNNKVHYHSPV